MDKRTNLQPQLGTLGLALHALLDHHGEWLYGRCPGERPGHRERGNGDC